MTTTATETVDVAIIGGGAAGLSAAVTLARSLRTVVVIDAGAPRNAPAAGAHNLLGREGIAPIELLRAGRAEAIGYGAIIREGTVTAVARAEPRADNAFEVHGTGGFEVHSTGGPAVVARRLLIATGLVDELPDVAGLTELWGRDVLHCPFCHGYEVRGRRVGVLGTGPMAMHQAMLFSQLTSHITLIDHGMPPLTPEQRLQAEVRGIEIIGGPVTRVDADADNRLRAVLFDDGRELELDALVVAPRMRARAEIYTSLGGTLEDNPMGSIIPADRTGRTPVDGVWAAGNSVDLAAMVGASAAAGVQCGAMINADLIEEDTRRAIGSRVAG
ncbi:NAD(P)/FAD-dependent oxidoreductase [Gordonia polyisoprenivorans]|uniref:NAD(P)/FAD-dependent oxidoreductase n=1 Tax=Gordonia polyisoprenivorans TaxID=84595 RepID=UPI001AD73319|nr:NAD(P)/FAD-dependent oxidoreductase [Gordonia polyisoprenivorans]QTI70377.1 NAD(P)/FAD-dependent oxidoreductase [Gordonia polyisoprenivorans]